MQECQWIRLALGGRRADVGHEIEKFEAVVSEAWPGSPAEELVEAVQDSHDPKLALEAARLLRQYALPTSDSRRLDRVEFARRCGIPADQLVKCPPDRLPLAGCTLAVVRGTRRR